MYASVSGGAQKKQVGTLGANRHTTADDINPAWPEGPETMGIMVYSVMGNAGFKSSTALNPKP